jgi:uncharacterized protein (TIGR03435 family)
MRMFLRMMALIVCVSAGMTAQSPQNLAGQWQGTVQMGKDVRLAFVITSNAAGGGYSAMTYIIDGGGAGITATVVAQGGNVRINVAGDRATFEGKLSADGNSLAGTFSQGPNSSPLTLARATRETAYAIPAPPKTMAPDAPLVFDVATVKPSDPNRPGKLFTVRGLEVMTINTTLSDLITMSYNIHTKQIVNGPSWMEQDKFDLTGRPKAEGVPNTDQLRGLIRSLLADRFKLTVHTEKRDLPAYGLTVGNRGHKLTPNTSNPNGLPALLFKGLGNMPAINATMNDFARLLTQAVLDRPVVDRTGLEGRFDFTITWTPDESQFRSMGVNVPPPPADGSGPPGLFTAVQEQLGLRIDSITAPVDVVVIDRVERPSEN